MFAVWDVDGEEDVVGRLADLFAVADDVDYPFEVADFGHVVSKTVFLADHALSQDSGQLDP